MSIDLDLQGIRDQALRNWLNHLNDSVTDQGNEIAPFGVLLDLPAHL